MSCRHTPKEALPTHSSATTLCQHRRHPVHRHQRHTSNFIQSTHGATNVASWEHCTTLYTCSLCISQQDGIIVCCVVTQSLLASNLIFSLRQTTTSPTGPGMWPLCCTAATPLPCQFVLPLLPLNTAAPHTYCAGSAPAAPATAQRTGPPSCCSTGCSQTG